MFASCARAVASCACAPSTTLRACSRSRWAIAPARSSVSLRWRFRRAISWELCAVATALRAETAWSRSTAASSWASGWPRRTRCPASAYVFSTAPDISARIVADFSGASDPESDGPVLICSTCTTVTFSGPTSMVSRFTGAALADSPFLHPATVTARARPSNSEIRGTAFIIIPS